MEYLVMVAIEVKDEFNNENLDFDQVFDTAFKNIIDAGDYGITSCIVEKVET